MGGWNKELEGIASDTSEAFHTLEYNTSQEAWEDLNESFLRLDPKIFHKGGAANSGLVVAYNIFVHIKRAWMDPTFDYGKYFNYTFSKWSILLNNYLNFNRLDLLRSQIRATRAKYNQNYNFPYIFHNTHDNGKQCLMAAIFSKRFYQDTPVISLYLRASELTKRLAFDLLLIQRMAEYVYGPDVPVALNLIACQMYGNTETLLMYNTYKPIRKVIKGIKKDAWYTHLKEVYYKFKNSEEKKFSSFKVFFRSYKVFHRDKYPYKPMLAKDLVIESFDIEYPENCISFSQRKAYRKKLADKQKKEQKTKNDENLH